jgi:hypothetical protein
VNDVGEFDSVLDEKDRDVVSNKIPISLPRIKLESESTNIPDCIRRPTRSQYSGESKEEGSFIRRIIEDIRA